MNFTHAVYYPFDEGAGTTVSDALGNGPAGTVAGTTTGIWANAGCLTINNAQGASGDNYIKLASAYLDAMCDLSTMADQSLVMMFWFNQPVPTTGVPFLLTYGQLLKATNPDGAWGIGADNQWIFYNENIGGSGYISRAAGCIEPLATGTPTATNGSWFAYTVQIDVFDGRAYISGCMDSRPQRGVRLFNIEGANMPKLDSSGAGIRLLAAGVGADGAGGNMWGQTMVKGIFIGRTNGEQRNNIPKWATRFYGGDTDWMTE